MSTPTTKNPAASTKSVALSPDEEAKLEKDCALSSVLAKAAYYGPAPFLHFFLKYMQLTHDNETNYKFTDNETWKKMYNLSKQLYKNLKAGKGKTNDKGLIDLLNTDYTTNDPPKLTSYYYFIREFGTGNSKIKSPVHFVCYDKTLYICIGWHKLKTEYTSSFAWENEFQEHADKIKNNYEEDFKDKINPEKIVIIGSFMSGCIAEILGLKLSTNDKNITVLTWNSPSWINNMQGAEWTIKHAEKLTNSKITLRKFRTHGSIYSEMPRKYGTEKDSKCQRTVKDNLVKSSNVVVVPGYKQLGDLDNFKDSNIIQPVKNKYSYYVKSHGYDYNISNEYIVPVEGNNEKQYEIEMGFNTTGTEKIKYSKSMECNGRNRFADRRWGKINASPAFQSGNYPWSGLWGQNRIDPSILKALKRGISDEVQHNLKDKAGGRRKTRKRRKRKGGRRKTRKNKRKTRRKSKKRRRRTRRRKRR